MKACWTGWGLSTEPKPADIKLYEPYNNRECLHCHDGGRKFLEHSAHHRAPDSMDQIRANKLSCLSSRCHDTVHDALDDRVDRRGTRIRNARERPHREERAGRHEMRLNRTGGTG